MNSQDRIRLAEQGVFKKDNIEKAIKDYYFARLSDYFGQKSPVTMAIADTANQFNISENTIRKYIL